MLYCVLSNLLLKYKKNEIKYLETKKKVTSIEPLKVCKKETKT